MSAFSGDPHSSYPLADQLPAVYAEDPLARLFATGLDVVFGPLLTVLDCLEAYFTPALAPQDFLDWLGRWVGAELAGDEAEHITREIVTSAVTLHRRRGTALGVRAAVRLVTGVTPEITESGGSSWSARPLGSYPGSRRPELRVTVRVPTPDTINHTRLTAVVAAARPAHMPFTVVVAGPDPEEVRAE